jgi:hypothetical protein
MTILEGTQVGRSRLCLTERGAIRLQAAQQQLLRGDDFDVVRRAVGPFWRVEVWRWRPTEQDTAQTHDQTYDPREAA